MSSSESPSPHSWRGHIPVAFVFSAPGEKELRARKPVAGETGTNLDLALSRLKLFRPAVFPSSDRYEYRITNAFSEPIAGSLGHGASEARDAEIKDPRNVERVLRDVEDCALVVLCGYKAGLLAEAIRAAGKTVVKVSHVGNTALNTQFKVPDSLNLETPLARREHRTKVWADALLKAIPE